MRENIKEKTELTTSGEREGRKSLLKTRPAVLGRELLWIGGGFLFGHAQLLFETYPLGLALLCASSGHTLSILLGLCASVFVGGLNPVVYLCTYAAAAIVRVMTAVILESDEKTDLPAGLRARLSRRAGERTGFGRLRFFGRRETEEGSHGVVSATLRGVFRESVCLRMLTSAVCAFIVAFYRILVGGFLYYDLFAAVFSVLLTPACVAVYSVRMEGRPQTSPLHPLSAAVLLFSAVWAGNSLDVAGVTVSTVLAFFFALYLTDRHGILWGAGGAVLCGLAVHPLYAPAFLFAALIYSLCSKKEWRETGTLAGCVLATAWAVYVGGVNEFREFLPACLVGGTAFSVCRRLRLLLAAEEPGEADDAVPSPEWLRSRCADSGERFRGISDAFSSLSELFYDLSDRFRRPGTLDLRRVCDTSFDRFCGDCPNKSVCWGLEYSGTLDAVNRVISSLHTRGKVTKTDVPEAICRRCDSMGSILTDINRECARLTGEMLRNNRTEIFAMDYEAAAEIINDALEEDDGEYRFDPETEKRVGEYLSDAGVRAKSVTVYGNRRRRILIRGADVADARVTAETMRADLSEMCGLELSGPSFEVEENSTTMTLQAKKMISVVGARNNVSADGGVSGDSLNLFSNKKDYFYALVSDGMGAGKEAAMTSGLCSVFLEKMLRAGNRAGTSLRMLNNMIRSRGSDSTTECSSTVDLLELDLMTSDASFIKSGAAPSFIIRDGVVSKLQSGTAPIGIIRTLDTMVTPFRLRAGDTVVLISDGIMQDDPECAWLTAYLGDAGGKTPEEIVYHICLHAAEFASHDDCSAIALRIGPAD